jgi:hypothetical protein
MGSRRPGPSANSSEQEQKGDTPEDDLQRQDGRPKESDDREDDRE